MSRFSDMNRWVAQLPILRRWDVVRHALWLGAGGGVVELAVGRNTTHAYVLYAPRAQKVKLGRTTDLQTRRQRIERKVSMRVFLIASITCDPRLESHLHAAFAPERTCPPAGDPGREWYEPHPDLFRLARVMNAMEWGPGTRGGPRPFDRVHPLGKARPRDVREAERLLSTSTLRPPRRKAGL